MSATARFPTLPYLFACVLSLFAVAGFWYGLGQPVILPDAATPTHKLQCASYTPFGKDQSPFDQPFVPRIERIGDFVERPVGIGVDQIQPRCEPRQLDERLGGIGQM